jgi:MFS family permease
METTIARKIHWQTIFSLAALDAGILISWTAYHNFQPKLLLHFHFQHLSGFVMIAQAIVMLSIPLMAGWVTDYYRHKGGTGFSVFAVGISVASMIFMAVAFTISDQTFIDLVWLLPVLIVFWLISMNVFHSPANSILEAFSLHPALPTMMAVLTIAKVVINAFQPVLLATLEGVGGSLTFIIGGVILIVSGIWFSRATRNLSIEHHEDGAQAKDRFFPVILFGGLAGLVNVLFLHFFPHILEIKFGERETIFESHVYVSMTLIVTAIVAFPLSRWINVETIYKPLLMSLMICFLAMFVILISDLFLITVASLLVFSVGYALVLITAFPYALQNITVRNATLGTGLFFASFEFFEVIFGLMKIH